MNPGEVTVVGRAEIDSRQPFLSVKEAVMLFGEKVLVAEIYGNKLKEMRVEVGESGKGQSKIAVLTSEVEETRQSLQRTKEEGNLMSHNIKALKQELEKTKQDVQQWKANEFQKPTKMGLVTPNQESADEFQDKRYVKFASPLAQLVEKPAKKVRRKPTIYMIGWLFAKKKGSRQVTTNDFQSHS